MHHLRHCCFNLSSLLAGLVLLVLPLPLEAAEDTDALLEKGVRLLQKGEYRKSSKVFQKVDQLEEGRSAAALIGLAMSFNGQGKPSEAAESARRALAQTEGAPHHLALGELVLALATEGAWSAEEMGEALVEATQVLEKEPPSFATDQLRVRLCRSIHLQPADHRSPSEPGSTRTPPGNPRIVGGDVSPPRKIYAPSPRPSENQLPIVGVFNEAKVQAIIDRDGCIQELEVLESTNAIWSKVVANTAREWVFEPARVDGVPVVLIYGLTATQRR